MPGIESELREREPELRQLAVAFEAAERGHGRLVLVEGAAGSGKSALAAAAIERGRGNGLRALRAGEESSSASSRSERSASCSSQSWPLQGRPSASGCSAERQKPPSGCSHRALTCSRIARAAGFAALRAIYWLASNLAEAGPLLLVVGRCSLAGCLVTARVELPCAADRGLADRVDRGAAQRRARCLGRAPRRAAREPAALRIELASAQPRIDRRDRP